MSAFKPLVSIIMPCFNAEKFVGEAISSVIKQGFQDWELLVCDDGSTDSSRKILDDFSEADARITVLENQYDNGAPGARNSCLDVALGRFIAFLDADDIWYPDKLEKQIRYMIETGSHFCFSYYDVMNEKGEHLHIVKAPSRINFRHMMFSNFIPCLTAVYDSDALGKVKQPNIKTRNDFALWLKIFQYQGLESATAIAESLASYRQNSYGLSSSRLDALKYYFICLREHAHRSFFSSVFFSAIYLGIVLLKKRYPKIYNYFVLKI